MIRRGTCVWQCQTVVLHEVFEHEKWRRRIQWILSRYGSARLRKSLGAHMDRLPAEHLSAKLVSEKCPVTALPHYE